MGVAGNVLSYIALIMFMGVCFSFFLTLAWKFLKVVTIALLIGCVAFYFYGLYFIFTNFDYYWAELTSGDQEAFWITAFLGTITLGVLGFMIWKISGFSIPRLQKERPRQEQEPQNEKEEPNYFQSNMELRLRDLDLLGLDRTASQEEIKKTYRQLSKKYHPDINPDPHAAIIFKQIQKAYDNLIH